MLSRIRTTPSADAPTTLAKHVPAREAAAGRGLCAQRERTAGPRQVAQVPVQKSEPATPGRSGKRRSRQDEGRSGAEKIWCDVMGHGVKTMAWPPECWRTTRGPCGLAFGGLHVDADAQVLDHDAAKISGALRRRRDGGRDLPLQLPERRRPRLGRRVRPPRRRVSRAEPVKPLRVFPRHV